MSIYIRGKKFSQTGLKMNTTSGVSTGMNMSLVADPHGSATEGWSFWIFVCLRIIQSGLCFFGNLLILVAIVKFESLHKAANVLIAGLASADLLSGFTPIKYFIFYSNQDRISFVALCKTMETITLVSIAANTMSVMLISVDRLVFILYPLHYDIWISTKDAVKVVFAMWVFVWLLLVLTVVFGMPVHPGQVCRFAVNYLPDVYAVLIGFFYVLTLITLVNYIIIGIIAYRKRKLIRQIEKQVRPAPLKDIMSEKTVSVNLNENPASLSGDGGQNGKNNVNAESVEAAKVEPAVLSTSTKGENKTQKPRKKRHTRMMVMVLCVYLLCTTPHVIYGLMLSSNVAQDTSFVYDMDRIVILVWWFQSVLNPVIYAWQSQEFKIAFTKLLKINRNEVQPWIP